MGKNQDNIHIFVTCDSLDDFDAKTQRIPSGINIYADVQGNIAEKYFSILCFTLFRFGMRPNIQVISVTDILGGNESNRKYVIGNVYIYL